MKFIPLTLSVVAVTVLFGAYIFLVNSVQQDVAQAGALLERTESLTKRDALARSMQVFLNNNQEAIEELSQYVYEENEIVSAIELLESTARSEGVEISVANVAAVDRGWNSHEGVEVSFSALGTFGRMTSFTAFLESLPVAARINDVSLEAAGDGEWFGTYQIIFVKEK